MHKGTWFTRALHVTIALSFILGAFVVAPSVSADPGTSQWEKQLTPTDDDKVILPGSDIVDFDVAGDGKTIYAIGTWYNYCGDPAVQWMPYFGPFDFMPAPPNCHFPKLWKSVDGGVTWKDQTSKVLDAKNLPDLPDFPTPPFTADAEDFAYFTAVSVAPDDPDFVVVAGWSYDTTGVPVPDPGDPGNAFTRNYFPVVVGSNDGASKFNYMGCATVTGMITCIDVSMEIDDMHSIAVGTWDWEADAESSWDYAYDLARVWRYDAGGYWSAYWADTGTYDGWDSRMAAAAAWLFSLLINNEPATNIATAAACTWTAEQVRRVLRNDLYTRYVDGFTPESRRMEAAA